ncbi:MAG TPA: AI-2E family transporter [Jatrophihabitans sp.]|jgi:predicted PurR-regulated permease PerM
MADPGVRTSPLDDSNDDPDAPVSKHDYDQVLSDRGSLYDPIPDSTDDDNPYGRPGRPISRQSAFYKGFAATLGVLVALAIGFAVREVSSVLVLVLIAVFLAVGLNPIVEFAIRRGMKRAWAVLFVTLLALCFLSVAVFVVGGVLRAQVTTLINDAPHLLDDLRKHKTIAHLDAKYHILSSIETKLKKPDFITDAFGGVFNVGLTVLNAVVTTVVVMILTIYFLAGLPTLKRALYSLAPATRRDRVGQLGDEILRRVGRYVIGAFSVALLAGTVSLVFLLSVGLAQYALPLALMVAILDLIPLVGSITGAALVSIVGLANSLSIGIACIVFYLIYETLEGYVIYPRVMRSSVDVPEYVTIIAVLAGGALGGVVGALLALPIAAALLLIVREVWVRRQDVS